VHQWVWTQINSSEVPGSQPSPGFFFLSNLESWVGWQSNKRGLSHFVRFGENYKNEDFILFLEFPL
jgi:hypothetical protein